MNINEKATAPCLETDGATRWKMPMIAASPVPIPPGVIQRKNYSRITVRVNKSDSCGNVNTCPDEKKKKTCGRM